MKMIDFSKADESAVASLVKAEEILMWLKNNTDVSRWVVLDDLVLHNIQIEKHQIMPDQTIGLTLDDVEKAEQILLS